jgi:hypothetical protein
MREIVWCLSFFQLAATFVITRRVLTNVPRALPRAPGLTSTGPSLECEACGEMFRSTLKRFDPTSIPVLAPRPHGVFALFLLVRETSILIPLIQGSREFFSARYFDQVFCFNEEGKTGHVAVENVTILFVDVKWLWESYPVDFDPVNTSNFWIVKGRKWGYQHMIRFFWRSVFMLPETANVSAYMRLDGDSCIRDVRRSPRNLLRGGVVYVKNHNFIDQLGVCREMEGFMKDYLRHFNITVANPNAWRSIFMWGGVEGFYNNLELMDMSFWLRPDVQHFVHFVDASWGIYLYRWGDAPLRCIAFAIFGTPEQVADRPREWLYQHPCRIN